MERIISFILKNVAMKAMLCLVYCIEDGVDNTLMIEFSVHMPWFRNIQTKSRLPQCCRCTAGILRVWDQSISMKNVAVYIQTVGLQKKLKRFCSPVIQHNLKWGIIRYLRNLALCLKWMDSLSLILVWLV